MSREPHPWYSAEKGCYMAYIRRKKVRLLKGRESSGNERKAAHKLKQLLTEDKKFQRTNPSVDAGRPTVASIIELYLTLNAAKYEPEALSQRKFYLQLFAEAHGWRKVNDKDCLPVHVDQWIAAHPEWKSDWTKAQVVTIIQRPFNWAARKRLIPSNPFRGAERYAGEPRRPLTDAEFQALLRHATVWTKRKRPRKVYPCERKRRQKPSAAARWRQVLIFLRFTGARPGEASRLKWEDIDLAAGVIRLQRHKTSKKTKKPRIILLHPVVVKLLIYLRRLNQPGEFVFLNHRKNPWNRANLGNRMQRARKAAGIPTDAKLYGTRHAFGIRSILNGVDIKTLAELMGHQTTRMTEHYLSRLGDHQEHLAAAMLLSNARRPAS